MTNSWFWRCIWLTGSAARDDDDLARHIPSAGALALSDVIIHDDCYEAQSHSKQTHTQSYLPRHDSCEQNHYNIIYQFLHCKF
jgi:hypothetical protein